MSESASEAQNAKGVGAQGDASKGKDVERERGFFGRIALFVRQVIAELKKVVTPSRSELISYTTVVIVFVAVVMAFVAGIDFLIGKGVLGLFGN